MRYPTGQFGFFSGDSFERAVADEAEFLTRQLIRAASTSGDSAGQLPSR